MSSHDPSRFDDSEDEEDFNPAPADLSDEEQDDDHQKVKRGSSPAPRDDDDDEDERPSKSRHADDDEEEEEEEEEEEDTGRRRDDDDDEDEEEEDEEDEDIQQVRKLESIRARLLPVFSWLMLTSFRAIAESAERSEVPISSISKPKSTMKTKAKTTRCWAKR